MKKEKVKSGLSSLVVLYLMGMKWKWAPMIGLFGQVFWFIYAFVDKQWGLLPCVIGYAVVHTINAFKWLKEPK